VDKTFRFHPGSGRISRSLDWVKLCFAIVEKNYETVAHDLGRKWKGYRMSRHTEEVQQARIGVWSIRRRIFGVQLGTGQDMLLNRIYEWTKQIACASHPARQSGARYLNSLAGVDL
jgi:hypothetical protein